MSEFLQTHGAWVAFAMFVILMRLLGSIGNKVWKHEDNSGEEDDRDEEVNSQRGEDQDSYT